MKKWLIALLVISGILAGGYLLVFKLVVPKSAAVFVPLSWQRIPFGEKRGLVHEYLGKPERTLPGGTERWVQVLTDRKRYLLDIGYGADSIATRYRLSYEVDLLGFSHRSIILEDSLEP